MFDSRTLTGSGAITGPYVWLLLAIISTLLGILGLKDLVQVGTETTAQPSHRPNILMIVADDLGYNDISSINEHGIHTPSLDELARGGVLFTRFYADSICAPSRVGLLTGREPERSGFRPGGMGIPDEFTTLPELLTNAGYQTKLVGKWHAGTAHRRSWPDKHGFQHWFGFLDQWRLQVPADKFGSQAKPSYKDPWLQRDSALPEQHKGHLTDILLKESVSFIEENAAIDKPWFLYHAFLAPHHPIEPASRFAEKFEDTEEGKYRALVAQMDFSVGELINALRRTKNLDNTLIVFLSDNGGTNRQWDNNFPFKGSKAEVFEGSYRTPMIIHWPALLEPKLNTQIVHNIDLYPTLATALSLPVIEQVDGQSLWNKWLSLEDKDNTASQLMARDSFRFWEKYNPNLGLINFSVLSSDGRWRLSYDYEQKVSLYDLESDPTGYHDVANENPGAIAELKHSYLQARSTQAQVAVMQSATTERKISGFDQMRVSDEYAQTILFELHVPEGEPSPENLLSQPDGWKITFGDNRRINFKSPVADLHGLRSISKSCVVVGLTRSIKRPAFIGGAQKKTLLKLYLDNLLQDSIELPTVTPRRETWADTVVNSMHVGEIRFYNQMAFGIGETLPFQLQGNPINSADRQYLSDIFFYPRLEDLAVGLCQGDVR